jgi:hypothetical protein
MTAPTTYQQWETASIRVDQSLALAKILRELFWNWENEHAWARPIVYAPWSLWTCASWRTC